MRLTKNADDLLCLLYKEYLHRRKELLMDKFNAKYFASSKIIRDDILKKRWSYEDADETCLELSRAGYLDCLSGDNVVLEAYLSDEAIVYMENRLGDKIKEVIEYIEKFSSIANIFKP